MVVNKIKGHQNQLLKHIVNSLISAVESGLHQYQYTSLNLQGE